jgi:hypothetical protein
MQPADAAERVGGPDRALRGQSAWKMIPGTGDAGGDGIAECFHDELGAR